MFYLILSPILQIGSIVILDVCDVITPIMNNQTKFNNTFGEYLGDFEGILNPCLFGNGKLEESGYLPVED